MFRIGRNAVRAAAAEARRESSPDVEQNPRSVPNILAVERLSVQFGGLQAVADLTFSVREGEIFGLIGPNGAGKTTCFNAISGFVRPSGGRLIYREADATGLRPFEMAKRGLVRTFQLTSLFGNLTARENVAIGAHLKRRGSVLGTIMQTASYRRQGHALVQQADEILDFVDLRGGGDKKASALSFREQRRLEIAIALAAAPSTLLLDEPAAGMNPAEAAALMDLVRAINGRGITIVLIEHNMQVVMGLCDRISVLSSGAKLAEGKPEEIVAHPEVREVYLGRKAVHARN